MSYLLDVNVLIARTDPRHESHAAVSAWLQGISGEALLFCPLVENRFLRTYGHPSYPGGPGSPEKAAIDLHDMLKLPNAEFVSDDLSIRHLGRQDPCRRGTRRKGGAFGDSGGVSSLSL